MYPIVTQQSLVFPENAAYKTPTGLTTIHQQLKLPQQMKQHETHENTKTYRQQPTSTEDRLPASAA